MRRRSGAESQTRLTSGKSSGTWTALAAIGWISSATAKTTPSGASLSFSAPTGPTLRRSLRSCPNAENSSWRLSGRKNPNSMKGMQHEHRSKVYRRPDRQGTARACPGVREGEAFPEACGADRLASAAGRRVDQCRHQGVAGREVVRGG